MRIKGQGRGLQPLGAGALDRRAIRQAHSSDAGAADDLAAGTHRLHRLNAEAKLPSQFFQGINIAGGTASEAKVSADDDPGHVELFDQNALDGMYCLGGAEIVLAGHQMADLIDGAFTVDRRQDLSR